jgi:hypothetical protein
VTDAEISKIADLAAEKAVDKALQRMYVEIGRNVLKRAFLVIGIGIVALWIWLGNHGFK